MLRITLKVAVIPLLVIAATIGVIRTQPYDDSDVRAFVLANADCADPCWSGIELGSMNYRQVYDTLENHPQVEVVSTTRGTAVLRWTWNGEQPAFLPLGGTAVFDYQSVADVRFVTDIPLWRLRLLLGDPERSEYIPVMHPAGTQVRHVRRVDTYFNDTLRIESSAPCPASEDGFWRSTTKVTWQVAGRLHGGTTYATYDGMCR